MNHIDIELAFNPAAKRTFEVSTSRFSLSPEARRGLALSARNAALLSSPLVIPAGAQGLVLDIVLDFESRTIFR